MGSSASCGSCCEPMSVKFVPPERRVPRETRPGRQVIADAEGQRSRVATSTAASFVTSSAAAAAERPTMAVTVSTRIVDWCAGSAPKADAAAPTDPTPNPLRVPSNDPRGSVPLMTTTTSLSTEPPPLASIVSSEHQRGGRGRQRNESLVAATGGGSLHTPGIAVSWQLEETEFSAVPPRGAIMRNQSRPKTKVVSGTVTGVTPATTTAGDLEHLQAHPVLLLSQPRQLRTSATDSNSSNVDGVPSQPSPPESQRLSAPREQNESKRRSPRKETWNRDPFQLLSDDESQ